MVFIKRVRGETRLGGCAMQKSIIHMPASATTGSIADVVGTGFGQKWIPTLINPSRTGGGWNVFLWWFHLLVWIICVGVSCTTNIGAFHWLKSSPGCTSIQFDCYQTNPSVATIVIGFVSGGCLLVGVLMLLVAASIWTAKEYRSQLEYATLMFWFLNTSLVGSFFIFSRAAVKEATIGYALSVASCIVHTYAFVLLYSTHATLRVVALPRAFVPTICTSIQYFSALALHTGSFSLGDHWSTGEPIRFSTGQVFVGWAAPVLQSYAVVSIVILRRVTENEINISTLSKYPFLRSTILYASGLATLCSFYVYGFSRFDTDMATGTFTFTAAALSFTSTLIVFAPDAKAYAEGSTATTALLKRGEANDDL